MKRNLFAIALALMLVVALVFVVAPTAKAETITLTDGATLNITEDTVLDLAGNSGTVNVAEGVKLSVYDSANTGVTGEGAGKLTVNGNVENEATDAAGRRFLAVPNDDGTYSFHPFFVGIEKVGVNTNKTALCLKAIFVANEVAQKKISTGMFYGATPDDLPKAADTYGAFSFVDGVMEAYFDLAGSLDSQEAIDASRSFQAYIKVGEEAVTNKVYTVTPSYVISELDKIASEFNDTLKAKMVNMITGKAHLEALCPNFLKEDPAYKKVASVDQITDGQYVMVVSSGYAPTTFSSGWVLVGQPTIDGDKISKANAESYTWTITVTDSGVTLTDANGVSIAPKSGNNNGINSGAYNWELVDNGDGTFSFKGQGSDTTILASNTTAGSGDNKIRAYKTTTVSGNTKQYLSLFTLYKLDDGTSTEPEIPTEPPVTEPPVTEPPVTEPPVTEPPVTEPPVTEPPVTEPPVTEPPVTEPEHTHTDGNADYKCDICSEKMLPEDGEALTVTQALAIAKLHSHNTYTTQKYYITGIVTGLYNTQYGNFYIKDADGNQICIYGLYSIDGGTRYDAMSYKPVNGDEVTVYTKLGVYNSTAQGKDAWLDDVVAHEHNYTSVVTEATCTKGGYTTHTCSICDSYYVDSETEALGHTTDNGTCERCGQVIGGDAPAYETFTADFNTVTSTSTSYVTSTTTSGWIATNCAVVKGGTSNTNPTFMALGDAATRGFVLNGKTSAKGNIASPTLSGGISAITFNYANVFGESNGVDITITIKQNGTAVASTKLDNNSVTQYTAYTFTWELDAPVSGDFTIEIINNSPSNSTKNKDRVAIWNLQWTNNPA